MDVSILWTRGAGIGGWFLRLFLMSEYNHVAIQVGDWVYEATAGKGVSRTLRSQYKREVQIETPVNVPNVEKMQRWLDCQVGKKYDWLALIAFAFRRDWEREDKWFCSELVAEALKQGGYILKKFPHNRITPRDLYFML